MVRRAVLVVVALGAVLAAGGPALAHATLLTTTLIADGAVAEAPSHVELMFNERVVVPEVSVHDRAGEQYSVGAAALGADGRVVTAPIRPPRLSVIAGSAPRPLLWGGAARWAVAAAQPEPGYYSG